MNTFSVNSLNILDKSIEDFEKKYIYKLDFISRNDTAKRGERLHALICYHIQNFDIQKIQNALTKDEYELFERIKNFEIFKDKDKFIKTEESFLVKIPGTKNDYYLSGRFDAIFKDNENYIVYDWKSKNIPKNPENELQSIVYLYCASKIFNTDNVSICYYSLETQQSVRVYFKNENAYIERILSIIEKLPKKYLT